MADGQLRYRVGEGQVICDKAAMGQCCDVTTRLRYRIGIGEMHRGKETTVCEHCDLQLQYRIGGIPSGKQIEGGQHLRFLIAISHRGMSNGAISDQRRVLGVISDRRRVLTKFQINLVIPKKQYLWLYFSQGKDMYLYGDFYE